MLENYDTSNGLSQAENDANAAKAKGVGQCTATRNGYECSRPAHSDTAGHNFPVAAYALVLPNDLGHAASPTGVAAMGEYLAACQRATDVLSADIADARRRHLEAVEHAKRIYNLRISG